MGGLISLLTSDHVKGVDIILNFEGKELIHLTPVLDLFISFRLQGRSRKVRTKRGYMQQLRPYLIRGLLSL